MSNVTRLQEICPDCGKVAKEKFAIDSVDKQGNQVKLITLDCFHIIKKIIPKATPFESMVSNDWKPEIKSCFHKWTKNQCDICGEFKLFPFQVVGARFAEVGLAAQKGVGIFDDMGLGKTVQGLAVPKYHPELTPFIVVTKSAITFQWFKQVIRWIGPSHLPMIIRTSRDTILPGLKAYIIPYDLLRRMPKGKLHNLGIKLVILDEVQQIRNDSSSRTQEVRMLVSNNEDCKVIELSATPWKNRGYEFYPALNLLDPVKFYSPQAFLDTWVDYYYEGAKRKMGGIRNIPRFKKYTETLIIRREYDEVMEEFPEVNRMKLNVQLDDLQQSTYDDSVSDFVDWYNQFVIGGEEESISGIEILAKMARMRHVVGLAKIPATLGFIEEFIADTEKKLCVFLQHLDVAQLMYNALVDCSKETNPDWYELAQELHTKGIPVLRYTSKHSGKPEGTEVQDRFNQTRRCILLASTLAAGEGLDLQTCADAVLHERQWNPQNEDQAAPGRFKRIGQTSTVINITLPQAEGTIDEDLDDIVETKRRNFHNSMNKRQLQTWDEGEIGKLLAARIVEKHRGKKLKSGRTTQTKITSMATM